MSETKIVSLVKPAEPAGPFRRGDSVKLRGGRVIMTVKSAKRATVTAVWHDAGDVLLEEPFHPDMLEPVQDAAEEPGRAEQDEGECG